MTYNEVLDTIRKAVADSMGNQDAIICDASSTNQAKLAVIIYETFGAEGFYGDEEWNNTWFLKSSAVDLAKLICIKKGIQIPQSSLKHNEQNKKNSVLDIIAELDKAVSAEDFAELYSIDRHGYDQTWTYTVTNKKSKKKFFSIKFCTFLGSIIYIDGNMFDLQLKWKKYLGGGEYIYPVGLHEACNLAEKVKKASLMQEKLKQEEQKIQKIAQRHQQEQRILTDTLSAIKQHINGNN